jgi:hypothetical protein
VLGEVRKDAGLNIAFIVYVEVVPPSRDAAATKRTIAPEIGKKNIFFHSHSVHLAFSVDSLLGRRHKFKLRRTTYRNVVEIPAYEAAFINVEVNKLVANNHIIVLSRRRGGIPEENAVLTQVFHSVHYLLEVPFTAAFISLLLKSLHAYAGDKVT